MKFNTKPFDINDALTRVAYPETAADWARLGLWLFADSGLSPGTLSSSLPPSFLTCLGLLPAERVESYLEYVYTYDRDASLTAFILLLTFPHRLPANRLWQKQTRTTDSTNSVSFPQALVLKAFLSFSLFVDFFLFFCLWGNAYRYIKLNVKKMEHNKETF